MQHFACFFGVGASDKTFANVPLGKIDFIEVLMILWMLLDVFAFSRGLLIGCSA